MALPWRDKKPVIRLPTCKYCLAIGKHYSYQCRLNPKNHCKYCQATSHLSMSCALRSQKPLRQEAPKTRAKRVATSHEWFSLNPPDEHGLWYCYLQVSPDCPVQLTRATIRLEHVKSKTRHPELRYDVTNIKAACDACNQLKGSLDYDEITLLRSVRLKSAPVGPKTSIQRSPQLQSPLSTSEVDQTRQSEQATHPLGTPPPAPL